MLDGSERARNRVRRHHRVRARVYGTPERPRMNVFRSNAHLYAQVIDDTTGITLVSASTLDQAMKGAVKSGATLAAAVAVGRLVAERALQARGQAPARQDAVRRAGRDGERCIPSARQRRDQARAEFAVAQVEAFGGARTQLELRARRQLPAQR